MKKSLITAAKISISIAILAYLFWDATRDKNGKNAFVTMLEQPKQWELLAAAVVVAGIAVTLTLVRWCYLVRALGIPLSMRDALRIGYLGYLFNLAPMGIVGGDVFKAVLLDREHQGNRAKAAASVIIDRVIGLYVLFIVATVAILLTGFMSVPVPKIRVTCQGVLLVTAISTVSIGFVLLLPERVISHLIQKTQQIPKAGKMLASLLDAARMYHSDRPVLLWSSVLTVGVHCTFTLAVYLIACGLPGDVLSLSTHFVVYPISAVAQTVPLPAGPFEAALDFMYTNVPEGTLTIAKGQGFIVALVYRLISVLIAALGLVYYLAGRREVAEAMREAEEAG